MAYKAFHLKLFLCLLLAAAVFSAVAARAQGSDMVLIRDAEIENTLKGWLSPLLAAAGMDKDHVNIVLVQSDQINAFVAGGENIFLFTGLIDKTKNPGELIGVMAHELGHIAGGHLIAGRQAMERASYEAILGTVLGMGAALAGGGGASQAIMSGSHSLATRGLLTHSRVQESSADQAALRFFNGAQISPSGFVSFFETMESQDLLPADQQSEYMRTHPLTRERLDAAEAGLAQSPYKDKPFPAEWTEQHARMKAKLLGFINPGQVSWTYADSDKSIAADYARAIAAYRDNRVDDALKRIDALIAQEPGNPYFQELKGQALVDFGRVSEAIAPYKKAVAALPESGLIRADLGHALLESGDNEKNIRAAVTELERALQDEPRLSRIYRLLATAYGRLGEENMAKINLAEEAVLQRRYDYARGQAEGVLHNAAAGSREALRARDIISYIESRPGKDDGED